MAGTATPLDCTALHCTSLHFTALYCTEVHYNATHCTVLQDTWVYFIEPHRIALGAQLSDLWWSFALFGDIVPQLIQATATVTTSWWVSSLLIETKDESPQQELKNPVTSIYRVYVLPSCNWVLQNYYYWYCLGCVEPVETWWVYFRQ